MRHSTSRIPSRLRPGGSNGSSKSLDVASCLTCPALCYCRNFLNCICCGRDYIDHYVGVGEHGDVAAGDLSHFGAHPLSNEPFHVGVDGAVVLGDNVPAWLRSPGGSFDFRAEQVGDRHALGRPNKPLFLLGQIACETIDAFRKQPDTSVRDFDVREDIRLREV
jgi:hypothetical protein